MGCENCSECFKEEEIFSKNKDKKNSSLKDLDVQDIIITEREKSIKNEKKISRLLNSSSKYVKIKNEQFNLEVLNEINKYRVKHGVEELIMDETINKISQKYVEKMARESELELSGNKFKEKELGEIIFSCKEDISPKELVDMWYNNGFKNYDYTKEPTVCNNFTQLIWKNSKQFGLGHILTRDNTLYVVANFFPEGNIRGQFLKNVYPIKTDRKYSKSEENDNNTSYYSITTKFIEEALFAHNDLREKHNSPPLILNPALSTLAQNHSEFLAKEKKLLFSKNKLNNEKIGENLFMGNKNYNGEEITSYWYRGNKKYNFEDINNNDFKDIEINNFTQLIWKNTREVGFGFSHDKKGNFYVVTNYFPCGNIEGQYQYNVLPY